MRSSWRRLALSLVVVWCALASSAPALDREAFSITGYDLNVQIDQSQQRLSARGHLTLRNDSAGAQQTAVLQISSSLGWLSIRAGGKPLEFVAQAYNSDLDHTGALSEAIVTLPGPVASHGVVDLEVAYDGVVSLNATRLTRIETPEAIANSNDWDQITSKFTAVRGVGYVAWYPIATEAASLSEGGDLFDVLARWKAREASSAMHLQVALRKNNEDSEPPELLLNATNCPTMHETGYQFLTDCVYQSLGSVVPTFVIANYETEKKPDITVHFFSGHDSAAANYADAAEKDLPFIAEWFGTPRGKAETAELPDSSDAPFESGPLLLTPLASADAKLAGLAAAHQLTHVAFSSPRAWINEGLAHFAQALYLEHQSGRQAAIDYMGLHRSALNAAEHEKANQLTGPRAEDEVKRSLINTSDEELYRSKAMCVWWMLRDMVGDAALKKAFASYHPDQDKEPSFMQRLIQAQTQHDLEWFFDDWVYSDRGLPDFKIDSAYARKTLPAGYMLTITVANQGAAGAEVPLTVKFAGGEVTKRLLVRGKSKSVIRIEVSSLPADIVVNDGSVPESDMTNNVFKVETPDAAN